MVRLLQVMLRFYHHESCGQCTPCREGMGWMHRIIDRIVAGEGEPEDIERLIEISKLNDGTTICGMGDAAGYATVGILAQVPRRVRVLHRAQALAARRQPRGAGPCLRSSSTGSRSRPTTDQTVLQAALAQRLLHPVLLLAPVAVGRRQLPHLRACRSKARAGSRSPATCRSPRACACSPTPSSCARTARRCCSSSRSTTRSTAASATRPASARCRTTTTSTTASPRSRSTPRCTSTKYVALSERIVLDNERCILCSRCVRFTREISKSNALGIKQRGDHSLVRASEDGAFDRDPYSDNVIDICPVGALLSRSFLHKARVWYLKPTPSVCPGCARGCTVNIWHRKPEWKLHALDPQQNVAHRARDAAREPGRQRPVDLQQGARPRRRSSSAPRAEQPMLKGKPVDLPAAIAAARQLIDAREAAGGAGVELGLATRSSPRSRRRSATASRRFVKADRVPQPGEVRRGRSADPRRQEPEHRRGARALFGDARRSRSPKAPTSCWSGARASTSARCRAARRSSSSNAYLQPENGHADVFIPISIQTERARPLHELRRRGERVRAVLPEAGVGRRRRDAVRRARRRRRRHRA